MSSASTFDVYDDLNSLFVINVEFDSFIFNTTTNSSDSSDQNILNTTTISDLIESSANDFSDLLQTDFSEFLMFENTHVEQNDPVTATTTTSLDASLSSNSNNSFDSYESVPSTKSIYSKKCRATAIASNSGSVDKKESNKAAANRYRSKKVHERNQLFLECSLYAEKNAKLRQRKNDLEMEIGFIKSLLVDALIKKNKKF
jgi:hypothetical protein